MYRGNSFEDFYAKGRLVTITIKCFLFVKIPICLYFQVRFAINVERETRSRAWCKVTDSLAREWDLAISMIARN